MAYGFVYVIGHELMDGVYKIGMTGQSPLLRCDELSSGTAIPCPFDLLFYVEVDEPLVTEQALHEFFSDYRVSDNREFFRVDLASIFEQFVKIQDEGAPLALTNVGEGYLALDAERVRKIQESAQRFIERTGIEQEMKEAEQDEAV